RASYNIIEDRLDAARPAGQVKISQQDHCSVVNCAFPAINEDQDIACAVSADYNSRVEGNRNRPIILNMTEEKIILQNSRTVITFNANKDLFLHRESLDHHWPLGSLCRHQARRVPGLFSPVKVTDDDV